MTLSNLFGSLTRRETAAPKPPAAPRRPAAPASSPNVAEVMLSSVLQFVPARETDHTLGGQREVRDRIADVLPGVKFDEAGHGAFTRTGYSVTFETGCEDRVHAVRVEITGGSAAMPPLQRLAAKTGWRLEPVVRNP